MFHDLLPLATLALGAALGYLLGRARHATRVADAADLSLRRLREQQTADDRGAIRQLPPTVSLGDALEHASRLGIGVAEAADDLYRRRVKALLDDHLLRRQRKDRDL